jgi:hypothetical protein
MEAIKDQQQWLQGSFAVGLNWTLHLWLMLLAMRDRLEGAGEDAFRSEIAVKSQGFREQI